MLPAKASRSNKKGGPVSAHTLTHTKKSHFVLEALQSADSVEALDEVLSPHSLMKKKGIDGGATATDGLSLIGWPLTSAPPLRGGVGVRLRRSSSNSSGQSRPRYSELSRVSCLVIVLFFCEKILRKKKMISMDNRPIEIVQPASPPASDREQAMSSPPASPEIRVTDSPDLDESTSLSAPFPGSPESQHSLPPTLASGPVLFQPFLPGGAHHPKASSPLPFSIDNILKPNFGPQLILAAAVAAQQEQHRRQQQQQLQQLQQQQQQQSRREVKKSQVRKSSSSSNSEPSSLINNNQPVDLSSKAEASSPKSSNGDSSKKSSSSSDSDVPPGMVRGPNGQLWPAWVFCTRYSDRPSSGKCSKA